MEAAVAQVAQRHGRIDVLVNAAGVAGGGAVHALAAEEWDRVLEVNLKGTFLVCKHVLQRMLEQRSGSIVNLASIEGLEGFEGGSAYNASKGGVVLLTRNLAIDYGRRGIRVNCLCPGLIETSMTAASSSPGSRSCWSRFVDAHQLGRAGQPAEVAAAALFLASDDASFVTGHSLVVDGGFTAGHRVGVAELLGLDWSRRFRLDSDADRRADSAERRARWRRSAASDDQRATGAAGHPPRRAAGGPARRSVHRRRRRPRSDC